MGRLRSTTPSSSLDLFLDTICNAFGGIMFLSILISVLLQFRGGEASDNDEQPTISEADASQMESRLGQLQSEHGELSATIASLEKSMVGEDQTEILEQQAKLALAEKQRDQTLKRQIELTQHLSEIDAQVRKRQKELNELDQRLVEARASLADKAKAIDDALDSREQKTELPKVRTTSKGNLLFLMRYGKLYLVSSPNGSGYHEAHVIESSLLGVTRIKPRPDAGWDMSNSLDVTDFELLIVSSPPSNTFFSCAVWPDSYEQFGTVKQNLLRLGYDYQLLPINDVEDLSIGRGGDGKVQ